MPYAMQLVRGGDNDAAGTDPLVDQAAAATQACMRLICRTTLQVPVFLHESLAPAVSRNEFAYKIPKLLN